MDTRCSLFVSRTSPYIEALHKARKYLGYLLKSLRYPAVIKQLIGSRFLPRHGGLSDRAKSALRAVQARLPGERVFTHRELVNISRSSKILAIICGSDQIWEVASIHLDPSASSALRLDPRGLPTPQVSECQRSPSTMFAALKKFLRGFDHLSVRERHGAAIIERLIRRKVQCVLDPCLLVTREFWESKIARLNVGDPYILCFFLNEPSAVGDWLHRQDQERDEMCRVRIAVSLCMLPRVA